MDAILINTKLGGNRYISSRLTSNAVRCRLVFELGGVKSRSSVLDVMATLNEAIVVGAALRHDTTLRPAWLPAACSS